MMEQLITNASTFGGKIDFLILLVAVLGGVWWLAAEGVFFYLIFKYKARDGKAAQYLEGQSHAETKHLHWAHWAIIACDLVIIYFAVTTWHHVKQELPEPDETIRVVGQQWAWTFVHPGLDKVLGTEDDVSVVDELHIKKGVTYHYKLESLDVLHDFSVPVFRLKQDAIPGRVITGWFEATKTGQHDIQCAEMCGIGHGIMGAQLYIETEEDHNKWLASQTGH